MLGRLPDSWWGTWEGRSLSFNENGNVLPAGRAEVPVERTSLRQMLYETEVEYPADGLQFSMVEKRGVPLDEVEIELFADLLGKMLRYRLEERVPMKEVVQHPWFQYG
ncbi:uncharacterized protein PHACADRAFT_249412 [Phanerochaete carnosa HHB-10118-sp]|uniref:Protein kinase domain-containing protein n=1 Tax=Phanerochaete carnosa (strain HHB-10118-sp) TaxID=650164 RepID=K5W5G4_PHACS|nr:uncharacterized protein PHACADRAFT_249412 [Phanerochaete carnosa HHB-10118-sp]EKM59158.1 hypothetical protein PHACADRAFT_249412 [Phanerochaete carnosa HHB-10118-sp]